MLNKDHTLQDIESNVREVLMNINSDIDQVVLGLFENLIERKSTIEDIKKYIAFVSDEGQRSFQTNTIKKIFFNIQGAINETPDEDIKKEDWVEVLQVEYLFGETLQTLKDRSALSFIHNITTTCDGELGEKIKEFFKNR